MTDITGLRELYIYFCYVSIICIHKYIFNYDTNKNGAQLIIYFYNKILKNNDNTSKII